MAKCKYISNFRPEYKCRKDALTDSRGGYCIFHEPSKDKDVEKFNAGIKTKMENKDYDFIGYYFPGDIDFTGKTFEGPAYFEEAKFQGLACFSEAKFQGEARFEEAEFQGEARFDEAKFWGQVSFDGAEFQDVALFSEAEFQEWARFDEAEFKGGALFEGVEFQGRARFRGAEFQGPASFSEAKFQGDASFEEARFRSGVWFDRAEFGRTVSFQDAHFKFPSDAEVAYRKAKISYQREGDYAEAGYYRLLEMRARRAQRNPIIRALEFLFVDLTCGYGEHWWKVILTALILVFGCALLYYFFFPITSPDIQITGIGWGYFKDCLYFSFVTFTTLGYGDLRPMPEVGTRAVASIEAFTGAFMMALFVLCFARKWMR